MTDNDKLAALFTGGFLIAFLLAMLVIFTLVVCIWGLVFKKAGYNFWLGLLMILPIANLVMLVFFVVAKWPIQEEVERLRAALGQAPQAPQVQAAAAGIVKA